MFTIPDHKRLMGIDLPAHPQEDVSMPVYEWVTIAPN
jgi:hypothetical protein